MKSSTFYTGEWHDRVGRKVKKSGYIEEYDGFRLCAFKADKSKWWVIEEYTGRACIAEPMRNLKQAFKTGCENLTKLAHNQCMSVPEFMAQFPNVNGYKEFIYDTDNKQ